MTEDMVKRVRDEIPLCDGSMNEALSTLIPKLKKILLDHPDAELVCDTQREHGEDYVQVYVQFWRDETDAECRAREFDEKVERLRTRRAGLEVAERVFHARGMDFPDAAELERLRGIDLRTDFEIEIERMMNLTRRDGVITINVSEVADQLRKRHQQVMEYKE